MARSLQHVSLPVSRPEEGVKRDSVRSFMSLERALWIEVLLLVAIGVVMIYSASFAISMNKFGNTWHYATKQLIWIVVGVGVAALVARIPYIHYQRYARWLLLLTVLALALVLIPGVGTKLNKARRWFNLGYFHVQPAEYAKVIWLLYLSASLSIKQERVKEFGVGFLPHMVWCGALGILLLLEPDFGTAFLIFFLTVWMLLIAGTPWRHLAALVPIGAVGFYKFVYLVPYRWERCTAFKNPWTDPLDSGYQLIQAWIAVGSGGFWGKGLGAGYQKLFYLPESFTDFILAVIGEELGFIGILIVCFLFFALFLTGMRISQNACDPFGSLLAFGLTLLLSFQAVMNMAVVLGLVPTKGLPLPFISYGGSAFTTNCLAIGMLLNIAKESEKAIT